MITFTPAEFKKLRLNLGKILPSKQCPLKQVLCRFSPHGGSLEVTNIKETLAYSQGKPAKGKVDTFCINANVLKKIEDSSRGKKELTLKYLEDNLCVIFKDTLNSTLKFPVMDAKAFPLTAELTSNSIPCDLSKFLEQYKKCLEFASKDKSREVLNTVLYDSRKSCLVATDGRKLTVIDQKLPLDRDLVIPVTKSLAYAPFKEGSLVSDGEYLCLEDNSYRYTLQLKNESYPDYNSVIPEEDSFKGSLTMDVVTLRGITQELYSICKKEEKFYICFVEGRSFLLVNTNTGFQYQELNGSVKGILPEVIAIEPSYFMSSLKVCSDEITICAAGEFDPLCIRSREIQNVIMPWRGTKKKEIIQHIRQKIFNDKRGPLVEDKVEKPSGVQLIQKKSVLEEIYALIECLENQQKDIKEKSELTIKAVKESQSLTKVFTRQLKLYERDINKKLRDVKNVEDLKAKLQKLVA